MANKSFVIQYLIKSRDMFSQQANKSTAAMKRFRKAIQETGRPLIKFAKESKEAMKKAGKAVVAFSLLAGAAILKVGAGFQTAMADLSAITGESGAALQAMGDDALRLGVSAVVSQEQVVTAFKLIASAKSDLLEVEGGVAAVTEQVLLLTNASGVELAQAADIVTNSLNQFSVGADQAARFVNILAAGSKIGASEVADTGAALAKVGKVANLVGIPFEELNAAIQVLAQNSQKSEIAGTGMKTMLIRMEEQMGKAAPSVIGLSASLEVLAKKNLSVTQMSKLFGTEAVTIGAILVENVDKIRDWTGALTGTTIAQEQAAKNTATFSKKLQKIKILIETQLIKTFMKLEPLLSENAEKFAAWIEGVDPTKVEQFANALVSLAKGAAAVAKVVGGVVNFIGDIGQMAGETAAAFATMDFGQFSPGLVTAIEASVTAPEIKAPEVSAIAANVNVGVQVGLAPGLKETAPAVVAGAGTGRTDVGVN